jgi:hypothetical protein
MRVEDEGPKKDWEPVGVFDLCEMAHMHCHGSYDTDYADIELAVRCLTWLSMHGEDPTCDYEEAVMDLVAAALDEHYEWKMDRRSEQDAERAT